jgi:hypothetical protein
VIPNPEKRKVGGSAPPLTTSPTLSYKVLSWANEGQASPWQHSPWPRVIRA